MFFFFNDTATTEIYTLSLHDALPILYLAPLAMADSVLTEAEKRAGCVLVDLGSGTTTVSVYYKNILRHLAVIPLGGDNITKDIASFQMEETVRSEEHTSELQSRQYLVCRLLLEKKKTIE